MSNSQPKRKPYRNRKLLDLAHKTTICKFRLQGCQIYCPDGCEPAHSNQSQHGKGFGQKADDDQHVASCPQCHRLYDSNILKYAEMCFDFGRINTFAYYHSQGWLEKVGYIHV